ncbi:hypothetical protein [Enterococcus alishanensis]|nr:hypothetical protein [Enterococcus alishanensis]
MRNYYDDSQSVIEELKKLLEKVSVEEIDIYAKALLEARSVFLLVLALFG